MKTLAMLGRKPRYGYIAPCRVCGARVVHAESTGQPFHMHRFSKKCREAAAAKVK